MTRITTPRLTATSRPIGLRLWEGVRRVSDANWFRLIACVNADPLLESRNPDAGNMLIGVVESISGAISKRDKESQLAAVGAAGTVDVATSGFLYLFANDVAWAYSNNNGAVGATIRRVA